MRNTPSSAARRQSHSSAAPRLRATLLPLFLLLALSIVAAAASPLDAQAYDMVIRNARVLDGTGNPWFEADVALRGDRIAAVGDLSGYHGRREIDAAGLYLAPGFIDSHSHAGGGLEDAELSAAEPLLAQGITTAVINPDGGGPVDLAAQRARILEHGVGVNVGRLIGHGSVRREVMGAEDRAATPEELDAMRSLVRAAMREGAVGLSSGLFYVPGSYAPLSEVVELGKVVAAEGGGAYQSHIRDEADYSIGVVAAVDEVITVAREAGLRGVVTHIKVLGPRVWGYSAALVHRIERARAEGVEVYADQYPYLASATSLGAALVPRWAQAGGDDAFERRLRDGETRARIVADMAENLERRGGADRIQFRRYEPDPSIEGRTLAAVAADRGQDPLETALDLLAEGSVSIVSFNMSPEDVARLMAQPWTITASDGSLPRMGVGVPHPRAYGTFPRKIRRFVREHGVVDLEAAIRSMTSLPAQVYGLEDRGVVRRGAIADLVVFDLDAIEDPATFTEPHQLARGMVHVLVNGRAAIADGGFTGERAGRVLRRGEAGLAADGGAAGAVSAIGASPYDPMTLRPGQRAEGRNGMVTAAHPLAAEAGLEMLRAGGNAVDAAVAAAFAVGVVEPMMSGMGGSGTMVLWRSGPARAEHVEFYAALGATPDTAIEGVVAGDTVDSDTIAPERGVAVPGAVAGLLDALDRWGTLPRERVLAPAIRIARDGFLVHPLLARVVDDQEEKLSHSADAAAVFLPGGEPVQAGDRLVQERLAASLDAVARGGADAFYRGELADEIVATLRAGGSTLTLDDFAGYAPNVRRPLCSDYRGYTVLTAAPPMGGVVLLEALNLLELQDLAAMGPPFSSPGSLGAVVDAIRIARADRGAWSGDPDQTGVPGAGLASDAFAAERAALVGAFAADTVRPGDPWEEDAAEPEPACARLDPFPAASLPRPAVETGGAGMGGLEPAVGGGRAAHGSAVAEDEDASHTTHLSVVDRDGNAVSLTYTMGLYFGTGAYAAGMFMNSAGYNFDDEPAAQRRAPHRSANSTIAPALVLDGGEVRMAVGSPGSGRISPAILHTIVYTLDFGYDPGRAISMPRVYPFTTSAHVQLEPYFDVEALATLRSRGYDIEVRPPLDMYFGGVHAIYVRPDGWMIGVADPRRDGAARGW